MAYHQKTLKEHLASDGKPKRILTLDGGGLKGILTLGMLQKIEDLLRKRYGGADEFRLSHYFDLIAGTSTGAIIAATLAIGWSVKDIQKKYMDLGRLVFRKSLLRQGLIRAKYDENKLNQELKQVYGADTKLSDPDIETGLLIITKRLDTGSPWPISNNPNGKYFLSRPGGIIANGEYPLWQVVRASTAAPAYFDPENISIGIQQNRQPVNGEFVDGGVSPFNNPALQAFLYATLKGYRLNWSKGPDQILLVSLGTGASDPKVKKAAFTAQHAIKSLVSLMDDCASLQEVILQSISHSTTARRIDRELGDLDHDLLSSTPLLSYIRYNVNLCADNVRALDPGLTDTKRIESLSEMDAPENMDILHKLGMAAAERDIEESHFLTAFDLS